MGHSDAVRFHGMPLSVVVISNVTVIVVADLLFSPSRCCVSHVWST